MKFKIIFVIFLSTCAHTHAMHEFLAWQKQYHEDTNSLDEVHELHREVKQLRKLNERVLDQNKRIWNQNQTLAQTVNTLVATVNRVLPLLQAQNAQNDNVMNTIINHEN